MLRNPVKVLINIGRIHNQQKTLRRQPAHRQVIEEPASVITQCTVLELVHLQGTDVIQRQILHCRFSPGAGNLDLAHVADIEESGVRPHALVLLNDPRVGEGHLPATKLDHARP